MHNDLLIWHSQAGFELNAPPRVPRAIFSCENFDPTARPFVRVCPPPKWGSFDSAWHALPSSMGIMDESWRCLGHTTKRKSNGQLTHET